MDCNCCVAEEVWNIIKLYPYQCRLVSHSALIDSKWFISRNLLNCKSSLVNEE